MPPDDDITSLDTQRSRVPDSWDTQRSRLPDSRDTQRSRLPDSGFLPEVDERPCFIELKVNNKHIRSTDSLWSLFSNVSEDEEQANLRVRATGRVR